MTAEEIYDQQLSEKISRWLSSVNISFPDYKFIKETKRIPFHLKARLINQYRRSPNGRIIM